MKRDSIVKLGVLLCVIIEVLLMYWGILPPGIVNGTMFCLSLAALLFIFISTSFSGERKKFRRKLLVISGMVIVWYTLVPHIFSRKVDIPFNESLWAAVIFGVFVVVVIMLIIKDSSDIDKRGNKRWITISKAGYACTVLATIAFVTALMFCIYTYSNEFSPSIMVVYSMLGIITMRRL